MIEHEQKVQTVDLVSKAERMIEAAIAVTTGRMHLDTPAEARALLFRGDETAICYFRHELGRQIGSVLVMMDPGVVAVLEDQDVPDSEEEVPPPPSLETPLRLFVHVDAVTPTIVELVRAIGDALAFALRDVLQHQPREFVSATFVTDRESRLLRARAYGFRPAPVLLAARAEEAS